tara:strand:- start:2964 stop:3368 length:405 start_codon:yes stop_codon:yes gene_type:complete
MAETHYKDFQDSLPIFVQRPDGLTWVGRHYPKDTEFPWKTIGIEYEKVRNLFYATQLYHSDRLSEEFKVGDGLDVLSISELHSLVGKINEKVKKATSGNKTAFQRKKCKQSQVVNKQRGLIRSWRSSFGELENE